MSPSAPSDLPPPQAVWTCPFCPLLCDRWGVETDGQGLLQLTGSTCPLARERLTGCGPAGGDASPRCEGRAATLLDALATAGAWLRGARQPLFGGLGTDVAGARALHALARASGAISDAAGGAALTQALRAQQDRGGYTTTLAEVHERADLIVFVGSWPLPRAPELLSRWWVGRTTPPPALLAWAAPQAPAELVLPGLPAAPVAAVAGPADLFDGVAQLTALVAGRALRDPDAALVALAARLRAARYAVLVWEPAQLGPQAGLLIERLQQLIGLLNADTRAAAFAIGGGDGAATVNQVYAWRSALPLRSRVGPLGPEHEPLRFDAARLLGRGEVDLLLWIDSFGHGAVPAFDGPRIVLGPVALAARLGEAQRTVFIPVATPGIDRAGHLIRADGVVMLPLHAARASTLPAASEVLAGLHAALAAQEVA